MARVTQVKVGVPGVGVRGKAAFPASSKVYVQGSRPDIRVPFREVELTPTSGRFGESENPPMRLYDTSGPYTDSSVVLDVRQGLPALRSAWILGGITTSSSSREAV